MTASACLCCKDHKEGTPWCVSTFHGLPCYKCNIPWSGYSDKSSDSTWTLHSSIKQKDPCRQLTVYDWTGYSNTWEDESCQEHVHRNDQHPVKIRHAYHYSSVMCNDDCVKCVLWSYQAMYTGNALITSPTWYEPAHMNQYQLCKAEEQLFHKSQGATFQVTRSHDRAWRINAMSHQTDDVPTYWTLICYLHLHTCPGLHPLWCHEILQND